MKLVLTPLMFADITDENGKIVELPKGISFEVSLVRIHKTGECVILISTEKWEKALLLPEAQTNSSGDELT